MRISKNLLTGALIISFVMHLTHLRDSVTSVIQTITNMVAWLDVYYVLAFLTRSLGIVTIITGGIGLLLYFKNQRIINRWLAAYIIIENFRAITLAFAILRFPDQYLPSVTQAGTWYYLAVGVMMLTLAASINYFSRTKIIESEYNEDAGVSLSHNRTTRLTNYIVDYLLILAISYDKYIIHSHIFELLYEFIICLILYYTYSEALFGRTLGKALTNTILLRRDKTFYRVVIRTLSRLIPFEPFSFLSKSGRGWHDRLSGMYLYKLNK